MADLSTKYLGLELKNPIIAGASNMSSDLNKLKQLEEAGASAVVYKSLFEEQIHLESMQLEEELTEFDERHPEMIKTHPRVEHAGPQEHLNELRKTKQALNIPVIASLNAVYQETWKEYAQKIEETGVDALELNFYSIPRSFENTSADVESEQLNILDSVKNAVSIPVSVKLSPFYSNPLNVIQKMDQQKVNGFVLFNRFFEPEINTQAEEHRFPFNLSREGDHKMPLRYAGLLYDQISGDVCSSTGIFSGQDVVKMILAGADCVQTVSSIYMNKIGHVSTMLKDIEKWMDDKGYGSLEEFRGKLSRARVKDPFVYKRAQYVDILMNPEEIIKQYKF